MFQPKKNLRYLQEDEFRDVSKYPNSKIGIFGEYSVPVIDLQISLSYWKTLGFEAMSVNESPYPWAIISDNINIIGLHQTTEFTTQAITYFAPDMQRRIEALKRAG